MRKIGTATLPKEERTTSKSRSFKIAYFAYQRMYINTPAILPRSRIAASTPAKILTASDGFFIAIYPSLFFTVCFDFCSRKISRGR